MKTRNNPIPRRERLRVRLTEEEADQIARLAGVHGLTVSDFARTTLLRANRKKRRVGRRVLAAGNAELIRELNAIGTNLQRLVELGQTNGSIPQDELRVCLAQVGAAIGGFAA